MLIRPAGFLTACCAVALATPVLAWQALEPVAYDENWYRADFWSGEYPNGISVTSAVTVMIRREADLLLPRDIACLLPENATYQPWNGARNESDGLSYVAYNRIDVMTVTSPASASLDSMDGSISLTVDFVPGDTWQYLAYLGEGAFLVGHGGKVWIGYQDLLDISESSLPENEALYHEWLGLTCANGNSGWLFMPEVESLPQIAPPRIIRWGVALDLDLPEPPEDQQPGW